MSERLYSSELLGVLDGARNGGLASDWRSRFAHRWRAWESSRATPGDPFRIRYGEDGHPAPTPPSSRSYANPWRETRASAVHDAACFRRDMIEGFRRLAQFPAAVWEPNQAGGDWRLALDAWYAASKAAFTAADGAEAVRHGIVAAEIPDLLEASYLAGIEAGTGVANGWRDVLVERMQRWENERLAGLYRLALLDPEPAAVMRVIPYDAAAALVEGYGMWEQYWEMPKCRSRLAAMEQLPTYWTASGVAQWN